MTRQLFIGDSDGGIVWDLLSGDTPDEAYGLRIDLASIVLSPLEDGTWEQSYRVFSTLQDQPELTAEALSYTVDPLIYRINRYGEKPGSTPQRWLYEKNEGEPTPPTPPSSPTPERRAILIAASFQPTAEGSVGPLMINGGYVGLLRLTRMDWEDRNTEDTPAYPLPLDISTGMTTDEVITQTDFYFSGSLLSRIQSAMLSTTNTTMKTTVIGIRPENKDLTNYQPIANMGNGLLDVDGNPIGSGSPTDPFEMIPYQATDFTTPLDQASPTYAGYNHNLFYAAAHTQYIRLSEISLSTTDDINDDYIGEYEVWVRLWRVGSQPPQGAYYKFTLGYSSYGADFAYNDAAYIDAYGMSGGAEAPILVPLGAMSIPTGAFASGLGGDFLQAFTISFDTEIITDAALDASQKLVVDSLMIMPKQSLILTASPNVAHDVDVAYAENPMGDSGVILNAPYAEVVMTGTIEIEPGTSSIVVLRNWSSIAAPAGGTLQIKIYPKYLTSKSE